MARQKKAPVPYWHQAFIYQFCFMLKLKLGSAPLWLTQRPHIDVREELASYLTGWYIRKYGTQYRFSQGMVDLWCSILMAGYAGKSISSGQQDRYHALVQEALAVGLFSEPPPLPEVTGPPRKCKKVPQLVLPLDLLPVSAPPPPPKPLPVRVALKRLSGLIAPP